MSKHSQLILAAIIVLATTVAQAKNVQVGRCPLGLLEFPTIQTAVMGVPPSSTIFICPGTYHEQVVIGQPVTLHGVSFHNQDRPVITWGRNSISSTANSITGIQFFNVVTVQNVGPPGDVDIYNITVDGGGSGFIKCGFDTPDGPQANLAGIFYDAGASGHVAAVTVRNFINSGCGYGIWLQNGSGVPQSIVVANTSVHDFDNTGIAAYSNQNPPDLSVVLNNNFVHAGFGGISDIDRPFTVTGIDAANVSGIIAHNVVTGTDTAIYDHDLFEQVAGITIGNNDIASVNPNQGVGIRLREGSTAKSNRISNAYFAFALNGGASANPGPYLFANTIKNTSAAVEYNCTANVTQKSNTINDAQVAYDNAPANFTITNAVNSLYNVDTISAGGCQ